MLILSRKVNQSIIINENIKITVLGTNGTQIRIGITAPKEVSVHREEIHAKIQREKNAITQLLDEGDESAA